MSHRLELVVRVGCSLCEQMVEEIQPLCHELALQPQLIDVDADPAHLSRYSDKVPVLLIDGEEICYYFLDSEKVRMYFAAS